MTSLNHTRINGHENSIHMMSNDDSNGKNHTYKTNSNHIRAPSSNNDSINRGNQPDLIRQIEDCLSHKKFQQALQITQNRQTTFTLNSNSPLELVYKSMFIHYRCTCRKLSSYDQDPNKSPPNGVFYSFFEKCLDSIHLSSKEPHSLSIPVPQDLPSKSSNQYNLRFSPMRNNKFNTLCTIDEFLSYISRGNNLTTQLPDDLYSILWDVYSQLLLCDLTDDSVAYDFSQQDKNDHNSSSSLSDYVESTSFLFHYIFLPICYPSYIKYKHTLDDIKEITKHVDENDDKNLQLHFDFIKDIFYQLLMLASQHDDSKVQALLLDIVSSSYIKSNQIEFENDRANTLSSISWSLSDILQSLSTLNLHTNPQQYIKFLSTFLSSQNYDQTLNNFSQVYGILQDWFEDRILTIMGEDFHVTLLSSSPSLSPQSQAPQLHTIKDDISVQRYDIALALCRGGIKLLHELQENADENKVLHDDINTDEQNLDFNSYVSIPRAKLYDIQDRLISASPYASQIGYLDDGSIDIHQNDKREVQSSDYASDSVIMNGLGREIADISVDSSPMCTSVSDSASNQENTLKSPHSNTNVPKPLTPSSISNHAENTMEHHKSFPNDPNNQFHNTVESLEHALKLQTDKLIDAYITLQQYEKMYPQDSNSYSQNGNHTSSSEFSRAASFNTQCYNDFMKYIGNEIIPMLRKSDTNSQEINIIEKLDDFDELMTAFISEIDGLDSDASEAMMSRKDALWFMNELKFRFDLIRAGQKQENERFEKIAIKVEQIIDEFSSSKIGEEFPKETCSSVHPSDEDKELLRQQEFEISTLQGRLNYLQEILDGSDQKYGDISSITEKIQKYESKILSMQDELQIKDKKIAELTAQQESRSCNNDSSHAKSPSYKHLDIETLLADIAERNLVFEEMRSQLDNFKCQKSGNVVINDPSHVRIRYLETIIHELENQLAEAKGSKVYKYDTISGFGARDIDN